MTRNEFIQMIEEAMDCVVFTVRDKGYTIIVWREEGISILEWNKEETRRFFQTPTTLVDQFEVDGIPLAKLTKDIKITEYC